MRFLEEVEGLREEERGSDPEDSDEDKVSVLIFAISSDLLDALAEGYKLFPRLGASVEGRGVMFRGIALGEFLNREQFAIHLICDLLNKFILC